VRNTGSIDAILESVWVRPNSAGSAWDKVVESQTIQVGKAADLTVELAVDLELNASYVYRVTTTSGFYYEFVGTTPASWT
jgi:hypothetical protein